MTSYELEDDRGCLSLPLAQSRSSDPMVDNSYPERISWIAIGCGVDSKTVRIGALRVVFSVSRFLGQFFATWLFFLHTKHDIVSGETQIG